MENIRKMVQDINDRAGDNSDEAIIGNFTAALKLRPEGDIILAIIDPKAMIDQMLFMRCSPLSLLVLSTLALSSVNSQFVDNIKEGLAEGEDISELLVYSAQLQAIISAISTMSGIDRTEETTRFDLSAKN